MSNWEKSEILRLSIPERIQLVEDIWDSITEVPERVPVSAATQAELDRRLTDLEENPADGAPWKDVRKRIRERS